MQHVSNRLHYSKETLVRLLSADDRNRIALYWTGVNPADGFFTNGLTLVTHDPYYKGWGGFLEEQSEFITMPELESVKSLCDEFPWGAKFGGKCLGGIEYRLKPELRVTQ